MPLATRTGMAIVAMALLMHAGTTRAADGGPIYKSDGAALTYDAMVNMCTADSSVSGSYLCSVDQVCPNGGAHTAPIGGTQDFGDMWLPVVDAANGGKQWVQVGRRAGGTCKRLTDFHPANIAGSWMETTQLVPWKQMYACCSEAKTPSASLLRRQQYSPYGADGFSYAGWALTSGEEEYGDASGNDAGARPVMAGSASGNCNNDGKDSASEILRTVFEGIIALAAVYIAWNWKDHTNNGHGTGPPRQYASQNDSIRNAGTQGSVSEL